jgi:uncharacterized protein YoxC
MRVAFALVLLATPVCAVTPIEKVIQMLTDMHAKGKQEMEDEQVAMSSFSTWCGNTQSSKNTAITKAKAALEQLAADIEKSASDAAGAAKAIEGLESDIAMYEADKKEASEVRAQANADFKATHADYSESIDAIERALQVIKAGPQGQALTQTSLLEISKLPKIPAHAKQVIAAFLQQGKEPMSALMQDAAEMVAAPEAAGFEGSSGGVVQMISDLEAKFNDERDDLEKKEADERHSFEMMAQELTDQVEAAVAERKSQLSTKNKCLSDKAASEGESADTSAVLASDEKYLSDITATCAQKKDDFAKRQELRQGELDAITKAIDIMSSDSVAGSGAKHLPALLQKGTSLVQLRSSHVSSGMSRSQKAVASFLEDKARETNSRILSLISEKVAEDPFKKVTKMIKDMIVKLTEEATEEAEHKGFCDTELTTNKQTRDAKTDESEALKAQIEKLTADINQYATEIADLSAAISDLDKAVADATAARTAEKEKNQATIADAKAGQEAVSKAMVVLKTFYDKAATATALVQAQNKGSQSPMPETFDEAYTGQSSGGVLSMLEVCESDFARLEADTTAGEDAAATSYESFMSDSAEDKAVKSTNMKHKSEMKVKAESALQTAKQDLSSVTAELDAAMEYYEKLKPSCVDAGESYEERVARRKEEIQSLQEALKILAGDE